MFVFFPLFYTSVECTGMISKPWLYSSVRPSKFEDFSKLSIIRNWARSARTTSIEARQGYDKRKVVALQSHVLLCLSRALTVFFFFLKSHLNGLTFLCNRRETAAWQMCIGVISSALSVKALFVTSEPFNWTGHDSSAGSMLQPYQPPSLLGQGSSAASRAPFAAFMSADWSFFRRICLCLRRESVCSYCY